MLRLQAGQHYHGYIVVGEFPFGQLVHQGLELLAGSFGFGRALSYSYGALLFGVVHKVIKLLVGIKLVATVLEVAGCILLQTCLRHMVGFVVHKDPLAGVGILLPRQRWAGSR